MTFDPLPSDFEALPGPAQPGPHSRHGRLIGTIVAVVVLVGGGIGSYLAFASSSGPGASSPTAAVRAAVTDLQQSDLVGLLDDLAPGERDALADAARADLDSLKRLGVLSNGTTADAIPGVHFTADDFSYGSPVVINDHVQVVPITGGSVDVSADATQLLTPRIVQLITGAKTVSQHAAVTRPVRIAAEQVNGRWYVSLFYTLADKLSNQTIPLPSEAIAATGATSPQATVTGFVTAALRGDVRGMIEQVSPDELGALHDYGGMIAGLASLALRGAGTGNVHVSALDLASQPISGGARVTLRHAAVSVGGRQFSLDVTANRCYRLTTDGRTQTLCADDPTAWVKLIMPPQICTGSGSFGPITSGPITSRPVQPGKPIRPAHRAHGACVSVPAPHLSAGQRTAITHLLDGLIGAGVDATQSGGRWYVAPVRTYADLTSTLLASLQGDDLFQLASIGH